MNTAELYELLEERRKITVACFTEQDYYSLRAGMYRARRNFLEAFALIDDTDSEDGFQLSVRYEKQKQLCTLELTAKKAERQWLIVQEPTSAGGGITNPFSQQLTQGAGAISKNRSVGGGSDAE